MASSFTFEKRVDLSEVVAEMGAQIIYIPYDIKLLALSLDEHACYPRLGCVPINEFLLKAGLRLPLHLFFRTVLRFHKLAPNQFVPNAWLSSWGLTFFGRRSHYARTCPSTYFRPSFNLGLR